MALRAIIVYRRRDVVRITLHSASLDFILTFSPICPLDKWVLRIERQCYPFEYVPAKFGANCCIGQFTKRHVGRLVGSRRLPRGDPKVSAERYDTARDSLGCRL